MATPRGGSAYRDAGVDTAGAQGALLPMLDRLRGTWGRGNVRVDMGHFANVVDLGGIGVAISTDGVGTKTVVADLLRRYDTVGYDCVAVNVNDVIAVGAEPNAFVDYVAVQRADDDMMDGIGAGLCEGAADAGVSVVGGETAQLPELLLSHEGGNGFDLAGACIGMVGPGDAITGYRVEPGQAVVGLRSSGIHCNGLTLARKAFGITLDQPRESKLMALMAHVDALGCTLGDELLRRSRIYVDDVMGMLRTGLDVRGLAHISGDGLLNLPRLEANVGYVIDSPPEPHPIFRLVQERAGVPDEEMYEVFNMGVGFCVVLPEWDADAAIEIANANGTDAYRIGHTVPDPERTVTLPKQRLRGWRGKGFERTG